MFEYEIRRLSGHSPRPLFITKARREFMESAAFLVFFAGAITASLYLALRFNVLINLVKLTIVGVDFAEPAY